jgi:hypothetical protein
MRKFEIIIESFVIDRRKSILLDLYVIDSLLLCFFSKWTAFNSVNDFHRTEKMRTKLFLVQKIFFS